MDFIIRKFKKEDKSEIISMMNTFYSSDAVSTNGSPEIFEKDFEECLKSEVLEGYVFTDKENISNINVAITDTAILDGQQRLTSLFLSLEGETFIRQKHTRRAHNGGIVAKLLLELILTKIIDNK